MGAGLVAAGVVPGGRVATLSKNHPATLELMIGAAKCGAVGLPVSWRLAAPEIAYIVAHSEASLLVVGPEFVDTVAKIKAELPAVTTNTVTQPQPEFHDPDSHPELLRSCGRPFPWNEVLVVDPDDPDSRTPLPDGEVGEIMVRSTQVMLGYWRQPSETAAAITADGFLGRRLLPGRVPVPASTPPRSRTCWPGTQAWPMWR